MRAQLTDNAVVRRLIRWGEQRASVRAMLLTSSRTNPDAPVDIFSDYDVILVVTDISPLLEDDSWLEDLGKVLVVYGDPVRLEFGLERFARITHYEDGTKIDYTVVPVELMRRIAEAPELPPDLDVGYAVLLDKDHLTEGLKPPTYSAYVPERPTEREYQLVIEEFFSESLYVAKNLRRDELVFAKYNLDYVMKYKKLRRMLEWRIEMDHGWSLRTGAYGKGLKRHLSADTWSELERTYVGVEEEENWRALFATVELFRKVAVDVGEHLGYSYPDGLYGRVMKRLQHMKVQDR